MQTHLCVQAREGHKITQSEMAHNLGVSPLTYVEYLRGTNAPVGMSALLSILSMLDERDLVELIQKWKGIKY